MSEVVRIDWIDRIRLPLMIGVVTIHSYDPVRSLSGNIVSLQRRGEFSDFLMFTCSQVFARLSVPVFFLIAGYFFSKRSQWLDFPSWVAAVFRRIRSLGIPFLFWNIGLFLFIWVINFFDFFSLAPEGRIGGVLSRGFLDSSALIFGFNGYPISYQFWFVRDLLILYFFSFPIVASGSVFLWIFVFFVGLMWFLGFQVGFIPAWGSILFFTFGVILRRFEGRWSLDGVPRYVFFIYCTFACSEFFLKDFSWYEQFHRTNLLLGVLSIFWFSSAIRCLPVVDSFCRHWVRASFFVFAFHEPLLTVFKKIFFGMVLSSLSATIVYFFVIFLAVFVSLFAFKILSDFFPKLLFYLTGGR